MQPEIAHKLDEWFREGLRDWDISRDAPYFGFEIPDKPGKYFYVWLDAPVGYMASFKNLCSRTGLDFDAYWGRDSEAELYHFIGKDIAYFHTLFWPAMLHGAGFRMPERSVLPRLPDRERAEDVQVARHLHPGPHLSGSPGPRVPALLSRRQARKRHRRLDLNLSDFMSRVNADLVGKVVNIASRCAGFIHKHFDGMLADEPYQPRFDEHFASTASEKIGPAFEAREYSKAIREIMALADYANAYIDNEKPWELAKQPEHKQKLHSVCSVGLNLFRYLMICLKPVLPITAEKAEAFLNVPPLSWQDLEQPLLRHRINEFRPLMTRVEQSKIDAMVEASRGTLMESKSAMAPPRPDRCSRIRCGRRSATTISPR